VSDLVDGVRWLLQPDNWWGPNGIAIRLGEHLWYSLLATALAVTIGIPLGLYVGHTGRGRWLTANTANVLRVVPTLGVVTLLFVWRPLTLWPVLVALTVLALPAVVLNTVAGVDSIEPSTRVAARAMGFALRQEVWHVELPCSLPLLLAGVRSAANQVIATATVAGFFGLGGLGRFLFTGYGTQRYDVVWGAALAVIGLVLVVELVFAVAQRSIVSPGLRPTA
jgi:osmoprotectant transport system permease protein